MNAKILIADDESDIVSMLGNFFESKGFRVLPAFNGAEALKQVEKQPDIILLDINMPGKDGLEVCKRIRDHISCPILFLTARIEDTDKVKGFTVGGDDYIVKPFSLMELEARVRAHLRREARHNFEAQVKFSGDLTIDYSEHCLFFGDKRVGLAKREFDIVELLSQNPGQIFDKERIYERIWGYDSEGDSSVVAEHIRRIRSKIAASLRGALLSQMARRQKARPQCLRAHPRGVRGEAEGAYRGDEGRAGGAEAAESGGDASVAGDREG